MDPSIGIYKITCKESGQCYIGQSTNIERRWKDHRKRWSPDAYDYEVLMACPVESLDFLESAFISGYDSCHNGLNRALGGRGRFGYHDDETRAKMSAVRTGKTTSDTTRAKQSAANKGKTLSDEHRAKLSAAKKGRPSPNKGKTASEETRAKMSESAKKRNFEGGAGWTHLH